MLLPYLVGACIQSLCVLSILYLSYPASVSIQFFFCTVEVGIPVGYIYNEVNRVMLRYHVVTFANSGIN